MKAMVGGVAAVALVAWLGPAEADTSIYTCRDRSGKTVTSDRPIADCVGVMRELGPSGIVKREIAPPMTPEQQRQKEADDRARRAVEETAREQRRRDTALLTAYQNEDQIESARKRALADTNDSIHTSQARMVELQKEKKSLAQEAESYKGKPPPLFQRKLDDNQAAIDDEESAMKQRQADVERVNLRYDDEKRRFRELMAQHR